jgi:hypothetical protein
LNCLRLYHSTELDKLTSQIIIGDPNKTWSQDNLVLSNNGVNFVITVFNIERHPLQQRIATARSIYSNPQFRASL